MCHSKVAGKCTGIFMVIATGIATGIAMVIATGIVTGIGTVIGRLIWTSAGLLPPCACDYSLLRNSLSLRVLQASCSTFTKSYMTGADDGWRCSCEHRST